MNTSHEFPRKHLWLKFLFYLVPSGPVHFPPVWSETPCFHWGPPQTSYSSAAPPLFSSVAPPKKLLKGQLCFHCDWFFFILFQQPVAQQFRQLLCDHSVPSFNGRNKNIAHWRATHIHFLTPTLHTHLTHHCELQRQVFHLDKVFFIRLLACVTWSHLLQK